MVGQVTDMIFSNNSYYLFVSDSSKHIIVYFTTFQEVLLHITTDIDVRQLMITNDS